MFAIIEKWLYFLRKKERLPALSSLHYSLQRPTVVAIAFSFLPAKLVGHGFMNCLAAFIDKKEGCPAIREGILWHGHPRGQPVSSLFLHHHLVLLPNELSQSFWALTVSKALLSM
jgi:hypothetical protein